MPADDVDQAKIQKIIDRMESLYTRATEAEAETLEALAQQQRLTVILDRAIDGLLATECSCGAVDDEGVSRDCARCTALRDVRAQLGEHWDVEAAGIEDDPRGVGA